MDEETFHLLQVEGFNDAILSSIPNGIVVVDVASKVLYVNREGERIFGVPASELMGRPLIFERRFHPLIALINEHRKSVPPLEISYKQIEMDHVRPDGTSISLGFTVASLAAEDRSVLGFVVVCFDLFEIQRLKDRARRAEALAALGEMAAGVAHEVRNPLHAIRIACELLDMKAAGDDRVAHYLDVITQEINRADRILQEVLDYSRPPALELAPTDVNRAVRKYLPLLEIPEGVRIVLDLMEGLPLVPADQFKLEQVLANLINNAKESMGGVGTLRLATSLDPGPDDRDAERSRRGFVRIDISDTGPGIPEADLPRIFELQFRSGKKPGGTGLGLSICAKIVEAHQGIIRASSPPGQGATFSVFLPVVEG
jgi:two-component system sensor histidine kinase PilS (NtrC family)